MKESSYIENDKSNKEYSERKIENYESGLSKSIQFVVNEVSSLLNYSNASKSKEQDLYHSPNENGSLKVNSTEIHKTIQVSSAIKIRSNNSLLLSLTALLSNPHHTKYLNVMTENVIEGFLENSSRKINVELGNKTIDLISKDSNEIVNLIASNLQYYLFEGRATNIIINDLVVTLMKAFSNEKTPNKRFGANNWETNSQVFIEARDWSVLIGSKECIFPKTCFELRDLLNKQGIKLRSYFENINDSENSAIPKINMGLGVDSQDTNFSSIDELDTQYFEKLSYSKLKEYKSNNIPNYSSFEQIKKYISVQYPNLKTFFYSPGSCIYINGNDVITFLDILKRSTEERIVKPENESKHGLMLKKTPNSKDPYWFLKDTKRIISNFPVKDTIFKASTCDCSFIHNSIQNKTQGFYELNIEGLFLPNSLYVVLNGLKILCPDINACNVSIENYAEPPFIPNEANKPFIIWEKLIPLLNTTIRSISPSLVEFANQLKPYTKVSFKNSKENTDKNANDHAQSQALNCPIPLFSLPRKRLNPSSQLQSSQKSYTNINHRYNPHNFVAIGTSAVNNSAISQIQSRNIPTSSSTFSNILFDFSASNGVLENINAQVGSMLTNGMSNFPHLNGSSSSIENQTLLTFSQNNIQYPPILPSTGIRARTPNSLSASVQWLNFRGIGFSSQSNSNYVSLSTPMGKQLLHRIGTINPIQRLEQAQNLINIQMKPSNTKILNPNKNQSIIDNFSTKIFEETALCFVGFDSERLDYFTARAVEEGAKVIKLTHLEIEYNKQYSKSTSLKEINISNFVYSWINVTRFYCVLDDSKPQSEDTKSLNCCFERIYQYLDVQQLVTLEWFLTSCFERRSLDPDMFAPICRPALPNVIKPYPLPLARDDMLVVIIENFPHMNKVYNSSKEGQESLSNAIWGNCIQRILKSIYGPNITNIKEISSLVEKNQSKWQHNFPSNVIVVPCNLIPYHSSLNATDSEFVTSPISALYGSSKCQFIKDLYFIKNYLSSHFNIKEGNNFDEIIHIVTPSWLLESCSKRIKVNYKEFEIKYSTSVVQTQRRRRKSKCVMFGNKDNPHKEEVCLFYKKDFNSKICNNIIPPHGPWPLWGWNIYIIDSMNQRLSESLRKKLKDLGAIYTDSVTLFEHIIMYSRDQMEELLNKIEQIGINLIICNDFLDSQLIKKLDVNSRKSGTGYGVSKKLNVVGESWISMVHGTRTLHPFECKFYFDRPNFDLNKSLDGCKGVIAARTSEDNSVSKEAGQNENCNYDVSKAGGYINYDDKFVSREDGDASIVLEKSANMKGPIRNLSIQNISKVNFEELGSTGSIIEENVVQDSVSSENNESNGQKRRRTTKKDPHVMENTILIETGRKAIENNMICLNSGVIKEDLSPIGQCNQTENEFLVPLSLSFMSNWAEGKNKDYPPMFYSSHTPIRRGYDVKEIQINTPTRLQTNWIDRFEYIEELINDSIYPNGSNDDNVSQTDKTTAVQKTSDESEDDIRNAITTDHCSPILCPIIPIHLNY